MGIAGDLSSFFTSGGQFLWYIAFLILIPFALYLMKKYKAVQLRKLPEAAKMSVDTSAPANGNSMSSFEAFMMGIGERVGVGNIVSVAAAIMVGGPGAIFWMWVFAVIIAVVSFAESTVSQVYKSRTEDGRFVGGPSYNVAKGYGDEKKGKIVAAIFLVLIIITAGTICSLFSQQFMLVSPIENGRLWTAAGFGAVLFIFMLASNKTMARINSYVVPIMALGWILICFAVIIANWSNLGNAFAMIFHYAFVIPDELTQYGFLSIEGVWEGIKGPVGALLGTVMIVGLRRGVFSNESGIGTISMVSSMADVKHPVKQGLMQSFSVFIDTIVICTCTALVILSYGDFSEICGLHLDNAPLVTEIMAKSLFGDSAKHIITAFMVVFTATTFVSLMTILESTTYCITKNKTWIKTAKLFMVVFVFALCFEEGTLVMCICDCVFAICAMINTYIIWGKRKVLREAYDDYTRQKKAGVKEPVFHKSALSDSTGVTEWD